jgi:hypothetical protein
MLEPMVFASERAHGAAARQVKEAAKMRGAEAVCRAALRAMMLRGDALRRDAI